MATTPAMTSNVTKLSFAKVAASAKKESVPMNNNPRPSGPAPVRERRDPKATSPPAIAMGSIPIPKASTGPTTSKAPAIATAVTAIKATNETKVVEGLKALTVETKTPSLVVNGTGSASTDRSSKAGHSQTPSDEISQKADSSSDLGTKPPSLDGKSITSGTTYNVLDEKESLRPDDSASVKAAAEDDDAFSVRGPFLGGSRMGSEVAARIHRIQLGDMPPRTITQILPDTHLQGIATPQSGDSEQRPVPDVRIPLAAASSTPEGLTQLYQQAPDEKLLEALQSPKDRIFLLRLEKDVVDFVQDSKEPFMDLPPSNSFCRMLTHKLADYYHMTHSFEAVAGAVRIYRTPFCRVPQPLSSLTPSNSSTPPPTMLPKKIMRRGEDGELAPVSAGPSKPTSEVGSGAKDPQDKTAPAILTREEREEKYKEARDRIFGSTGPTETSTPENADGTGVSRESSVSARDRSNLGKRGPKGKRRPDDSDSFDSRANYTAYYGHPQQALFVAPQYIPVGNPQFNGPVPQQPYPNAMQQGYGPPNQGYPPMMPNSGFVPQVNNMPPFPPQPQPSHFQPPTGPMQQFNPPVQNVPQGVPQQAWQSPKFNQSPYQSRATPAGPPGIPYAYGQLPVNMNPNDPKSQHPIPGSYAGSFHRNGFNPKTQSFVPGAGMPPMQASPPVGFPVANGMAGPPASVPQIAFNGYQQPMPQSMPQAMPPNQPFNGNGGDYAMMRQGSNNSMSMPQYHGGPPIPQQPVYQGPPPPMAAPLPQPLQHLPQQNSIPPHLANRPPNMPPTGPAAMTGGGGGGGGGPPPLQQFNHLPNYGNPATLPQKPSTT